MTKDEIDGYIHSYVERHAEAFRASVVEASREDETLYITIFPEQMIDDAAIAFSTLGASERVPTGNLPNILPDEFMNVDEITGGGTATLDPLGYVGLAYLTAVVAVIRNPNPAIFTIEIGVHESDYTKL